jgi:hypothetical protein
MADTSPGDLFVRRDIYQLEATDPWDPYTTAYAEAVRVMQGLDADDPTSWTYQSAMHGTYATPDKPDWNGCQHASWFFLPWHRMYIYAFEAIVRGIVIDNGGPADWSLPYWDWTKNRAIPVAFRQEKMPDGTDNPLFNTHRNPKPAPGINGGAQLPASVTATDYAFSFQFFETGVRQNPLGGGLDTGFGGGPSQATQFGPAHGALEDQPHNIIHDLVGGPADDNCGRGWMSDPFCAATDPIFWLHHSNIDRLWNNWVALGGTRVNPNVQSWLTQSFNFFDPQGQQESWQVAQVRTTQGLGYRYASDPPPVAQPLTLLAEPDPEPDPGPIPDGGAAADVPALGTQTDVAVGATPSTVTVDLAADAPAEVKDSLPTDKPYEAPAVYLLVDDIAMDKHPGVVYGVYLNRPDADENTGHYNENFAGYLSFFGVSHGGGGGHDHGPAARKYDVTSIVRYQQELGTWDPEKATITFVPTGLETPEGEPDEPGYGSEPDDANVRLGQVKLAYGT